jgi:two-component system OmpR family sensor kinase
MDHSDGTNYFRDLYELGADPSTSLETKIEQAIAVGRDRLGVPYGVLSYTGSGEYEIIDSTFSDGEYTAGSVQDLGTTWCRHVVGQQELLAIDDAGASDYEDDIAREMTNLQCYIGAPILIDGETFGTLCYSGEQPRDTEFTDDEKRFVRLVTRWIGYELERAKHYETLDTQNERLDEFAGVLAHDLRNPLTAARAYTELVSESVSDEEAEHLQTALDALDRMEALISDTLSLAREGADVGERQPVSLGSVARTAWETVDPADATLVVEQDRSILADESRLRQLFENLFRNVEEHCGTDVTVTVRGTDSGFVVADDGPGLPPDIAETLFGGRFESARPGLGLLIVERVASGHGWDATVDCLDGTRFEFSNVGTVTEIPRLE